MKITQHPSNNKVLAAPPGMPPEQCKAAPVTTHLYEDHRMGHSTFWKPDYLELAVLNAGGFVEVEILGANMPPLKVSAVRE